VRRVLTLTLFAAVFSTGCANTWDTITSRKFRKDPFNQTYRLWVPEEPMVVLRATPQRDGDERAKAMHRLKEPLAAGLSQQDQEEIIELLAKTATKDASPVLRIAAIDALGRFEDPRAAGILLTAYQTAHGRPEGSPDPAKAESAIQLAGASGMRSNGRPTSALSLTGPTGFSPETVEAIRCRALESLGRTNRPEAVQFLAAVAAGPTRQSAPEGADDREIRLAAVRGLTRCRQSESVIALAQVLTLEKGKGDTALVGRAHDGLVNLTGKHLPPDPAKWNEVVQAGVEIAREPSWVDHAFEWVKK